MFGRGFNPLLVWLVPPIAYRTVRVTKSLQRSTISGSNATNTAAITPVVTTLSKLTNLGWDSTGDDVREASRLELTSTILVTRYKISTASTTITGYQVEEGY